ncbi:synaptic vesicle glycoprotein 2A [Manduca sexta]|uniref:synaptic vesicle glycoprotein 2A n=1 Tax=Manduca sexta TaxID=7130 RepID=UPI00189087E9|nr:synaptic vesicle glycoprotein 2A [Manduca sexta]
MAEEQAWLVRTRSDSESSSKLSFGSISRTMTYTEHRLAGECTDGAGEPGNTINMAASPPDNVPDGNESGELLDYNDASVLEQFHEDALRQAGCGVAQARVVVASALALAGAALELAAIPFVLPSAEIELCILPHEKNWLVMISLVGGSLGAVGWGMLAERLGRRRALLSCLAVNAVFAAIAAFMPTYGTFMMARFCSAIGSGGAVVTSFTYVAEVCMSRWRRAALAAAAAGLAAGAALAAALARALLPSTGALALIENKEHFSAWHRYLLLCTLPILASLISLIWTPESPRYLLDVGREVDAMVVYQSIHSSNQRRGGRGRGGRRGGEAAARAAELALPGKRRPPALHHVRHSVKMFWQAFFQLFSTTYRTTTLSLGGALLFSTAIQFYLSSYVPSTVVAMESEEFEASKRIIENRTLVDEHYNGTLENVHYLNVSFVNCTFRDMLMSHVAFKNCSFANVALSNIKTSYATFEGSLFVNSTIIDTDMEVGRELDAWCRLERTVVRGVQGGCARHADLTSRLRGPLAELGYQAHAALLAAVAALLPARLRPTVGLCIACVLLSPLLYIAQTETMLYVVEAVYRLFVMLIFFNVAVGVVDLYPANLRCTAHGVIVSVSLAGAALVRGCSAGAGAGAGGAALAAVLCALLAAAATLAALPTH